MASAPHQFPVPHHASYDLQAINTAEPPAGPLTTETGTSKRHHGCQAQPTFDSSSAALLKADRAVANADAAACDKWSASANKLPIGTPSGPSRLPGLATAGLMLARAPLPPINRAMLLLGVIEPLLAGVMLLPPAGVAGLPDDAAPVQDVQKVFQNLLLH